MFELRDECQLEVLVIAWGALFEKCLYSVFFCSEFSGIQIEYGEMLSISPYSVQMRENMGL